ncbi:MAG: LPXTG cell wall anchor domain-containing protein [Lachnospiraceae bacterium]|nr:LPXTG cell wall anchor domain-containing protein [Lachnospiraceae bacterium]
MKKWIFSILLTVMMCLALLPNTVVSAAASVAQIGDTTYATLDEAVTAAADGDTIIVLQSCETSGLNLSKDLTIKGADGVNPTITFNTYGIALWANVDLVFEDCTVEMNNITSTPYTGEWNWMAICASDGVTLTLNNVDMSIVCTESNNAHCIYFCNDNKLNLNYSTLYIKGYKQDALEWDGGNGGYNINFKNSTFISDNNRSGFTGTFYVTIEDSDVQVINSSGNGSNGSNFIITNSTVDFSDNVSHGLSTGILTVTDSTITANNNGLTGIIFNNTATFKNSDVTITGTKGTSYWNAGMRAMTSNASCTIDADCTFSITDNYVTGIFLDASTSLTIAEGADVVVTGNEAMQKNCSTDKDLAKSGGGIVVRSGATATLSRTTQIYNNHAALAGDDIYLEGDTSSITFCKTDEAWYLNATYLDSDETHETHCKHFIDGWYNDGYTGGVSSARWEADAKNEDDNYISLYEVTDSVTATGVLALKAAHGTDPVEAEGKVTIPGLDKTIVTEDGGVDQVSVKAGDTVEFKLESIVPGSDTIKDSISYAAAEGSDENWVIPVGSVVKGEDGEPVTYTLTFHDVMNSGLTLVENSIQVSVLRWVVELDDETGLYSTTGETELVYVTEYADIIKNPGDSCTFEVSIDLLTLYAKGIITEADFSWAPVYVTYEATLTEGATAGAYTNTAWVVSPDGTSEQDQVEVDTYGVEIFKYDQTDSETDGEGNVTYAGLPGATFALYQKATVVSVDGSSETDPSDDSDDPSGENSNDNSNETIILLSAVAEDVTIDDLTSEDGGYVLVETLVSRDDGYVYFEGLAEGIYYLVELEAPSGYVKADTVLEILIKDDVDAATFYAHADFANAPIPSTGGMGTTIFRIVGMSLLLAAGAVYVFTLRRKED